MMLRTVDKLIRVVCAGAILLLVSIALLPWFTVLQCH